MTTYYYLIIYLMNPSLQGIYMVSNSYTQCLKEHTCSYQGLLLYNKNLNM